MIITNNIFLNVKNFDEPENIASLINEQKVIPLIKYFQEKIVKK